MKLKGRRQSENAAEPGMLDVAVATAKNALGLTGGDEGSDTVSAADAKAMDEMGGGGLDEFGKLNQSVDRRVETMRQQRKMRSRFRAETPERVVDQAKFANGGMVGRDYAKPPGRKAMKALDNTGRTINDYAKLTPYGR